MDEYESLSHTQMGVQISRGVHSEVPQEDAVRGAAPAPRERCSASWRSRRRAGSRRGI